MILEQALTKSAMMGAKIPPIRPDVELKPMVALLTDVGNNSEV